MSKTQLIGSLIAFSLSFGSALASDIATVRIVNTQGEQTVEVDLDELKVGQNRQLAAASGAPAIVSRSEEGLRIEIAGRTTEVKLAQPGEHGGHQADGAQRIKFVHVDKDHAAGDGDKKVHKVVVMRNAEHGESGDADLESLAAEAGVDVDVDVDVQTLEGDEQRVFVTRKIVREAAQD